MRRRDVLIAGLTAAAAHADVPAHLWAGYDFGPGPRPADRLNQGPFGIEQDEGWFTIATTSPSEAPVANFGLGLVGYTWEEGGPSLAARAGRETLEAHVDKMARLPFVDVLYIRCDWRDVQKRPGKLDLSPVWRLTLDAAKQYGRRVAFRVMLSNTVGQPQHLAMPDFVQAKVPVVPIGRLPSYGDFDFREPRYDHPEFQKAFRDLVELLAAEFDSNPAIEWMDLMQFGFWGESHTGGLRSPFADYPTAERTMVDIARLQLESFRRVQIAVNTQPDISNVGNREVIDMAVRAGCWLRSDSVIVEEPEQIEELADRPPWLATIMEDGYYRRYEASMGPMLENTMLHVLDLGANYWSLWTETDNLARFNDRFPRGFTRLRQRMGYRLRPSWVWQRKRYGTNEIIVCISNDGVAGVPGILRLSLERPDGTVISAGGLDAGHPYGGRLRLASFLLPSSLREGVIHLKAEIETKGGVRRPVQWASEQPVEIRLKPWNDTDWRKNV
jgi:hypothetical protein